MRKIFQSMDKNFDGVLSKAEVMNGMEIMGYDNPREEAERIFALADLNGNGTVEFTEWASATMDKELILTKPKLKQAFQMFDKDNSG